MTPPNCGLVTKKKQQEQPTLEKARLTNFWVAGWAVTTWWQLLLIQKKVVNVQLTFHFYTILFIFIQIYRTFPIICIKPFQQKYLKSVSLCVCVGCGCVCVCVILTSC